MKAAWYENNGQARDVLAVGELPRPEPRDGEVRVRLETSGVNPSDVKARLRRPMIAPRIVPHSDGAGVIDAIGRGVPRSRIGERVWTWNGQWKRPFGTAAEYIVLPSEQAIRLPENVDYEVGACLGIPALTAVHAVRLSNAAAGRTIFVTGGATSVGHYATQIAVLRGARVITTASERRVEHARSAGADEVIDYRTEDVAVRVRELTEGRGVDAIIDMDISSTAPLLSRDILAPHGRIVCYGSNVPDDIPVPFLTMLRRSLTLQFFLLYELLPDERNAATSELTTLLEKGRLAHAIGARFPLAEIAAAHESVELGSVIGNVLLDLA
jgi:NADPH2:quinone reductase